MKFTGNIVALVTPFTDNGEISWPDLDSLIDYHLGNNTQGIVALGTTGESATLELSEKQQIVTRILAKIKVHNKEHSKSIPLIVGTGSNCTKNTIEMTNLARQWGADAALVVTPYYNKPTQNGLYQHYKAVADNVADMPILLYNVPGRTAVDMLPDTVAKLAKLKNIVGIKEASSDLSKIKSLINLCRSDDFIVLSGDDASFLGLIKLGGSGVISVASNIVPKDITNICDLALNFSADSNNLLQAEEINNKLNKLYDDLFVEANPIPVKWLLYKLGLISSPMCRLPLTILDQKYHNSLSNTLEELDFSLYNIESLSHNV